jgi:hypothetical protein
VATRLPIVQLAAGRWSGVRQPAHAPDSASLEALGSAAPSLMAWLKLRLTGSFELALRCFAGRLADRRSVRQASVPADAARAGPRH